MIYNEEAPNHWAQNRLKKFKEDLGSLFERITKRFGLNDSNLLDCGGFACAWRVDDLIYKITKSEEDGELATEIMGLSDFNDVLVEIYSVFSLPKGYYLIVEESLHPISIEYEHVFSNVYGGFNFQFIDQEEPLNFAEFWKKYSQPTLCTFNTIGLHELPVFHLIFEKFLRLVEVAKAMNSYDYGLIHDAHKRNWGLRIEGDISSMVLLDIAGLRKIED